jgi:hypothetical protein
MYLPQGGRNLCRAKTIGNDMKNCHFFLRALPPGVFVVEKNRKMIAKYGKNA